MKRLRDWNIGARIAAVLVLGIGLLVIQVLLAIRATNADDAARQRQVTVAQNVRDLDNLLIIQSNLAYSLVEYLETRDLKWGASARANLADLDTALTRQSEIAQSEVLDSEGTEALEFHMAPFGPTRTWVREVVTPALAAGKDVQAGLAPESSLGKWVAQLRDREAVAALSGPVLDYIRGHISDLEGDQSAAAAAAAQIQFLWVMIGGSIAVILLGGGGVVAVGAAVGRRLSFLESATQRMGKGDLTTPIKTGSRDEFGRLGEAIDAARESLHAADVERRRHDLVQRTRLELGDAIKEGRDLTQACTRALGVLVDRTGSSQAVFYLAEQSRSGGTLRRIATFADEDAAGNGSSQVIAFGQGLLGEAAVSQTQVVLEAPPGFIRVTSALGATAPVEVVIRPFVLDGRTVGVAELAALHTYSVDQLHMLSETAPIVASHLAVVMARHRTEELLEESQAQAEELQAQSEELESQHNELQEANRELQARAVELGQQRSALEERNAELERSRADLAHRTELLDLASQYKSQFLSKMSHELRTPLNSILILSERLAANGGGNLDERQVEFANTIEACGRDLLALINDVLDLSKVEAGRVDLDYAALEVESVMTTVDRQFRAVAEERGLRLSCVSEPDAPREIVADRLRVEQILKNLVSNACKFTEEGSITVRARAARPDETPPGNGSATVADFMCFEVVDTGVGIHEIDRDAVFEPFQQVDSSRRRRQGGTGLGLSISRELAHAMGGTLLLASEPGEGSAFTFVLPIVGSPGVVAPGTVFAAAPRAGAGTVSAPGRPQPTTADTSHPPAVGEAAVAPARTQARAAGTPEKPVPGDAPADDDHARRILIVEDDPVFAGLLAETARAHGFTPVVEPTGAGALAAALQLQPSAISLDIGLPDMDGWVLLDRFRRESRLRHIPVQIISGKVNSGSPHPAGVVGVAAKPLSNTDMASLFSALEHEVGREVHNLLIVEDDRGEAAEVARVAAGPDVAVSVATTGAEALEILAGGHIDCAVVDLRLPDMSGFELINTIRANSSLSPISIVIYTALELTDDQRRHLERVADSIIIKGEQSRARLLDETSLFLHRVAAQLPEEDRQQLARLYDRDPTLSGRTVLVVDDDPRNVFSLAAVLEHHEMRVIDAENGREALAALQEHPDVDIVLMDIMMPEMDGYEAMRRIRAKPNWRELPVIALTAMAMPEDRDRAIQAGASDYMSKPVDTDQLISLLRVWLSR